MGKTKTCVATVKRWYLKATGREDEGDKEEKKTDKKEKYASAEACTSEKRHKRI